jgi:hypothetical protein
VSTQQYVWVSGFCYPRPSPAATKLLQALHKRYHYENDLSFNRIIIEGVGLDLGHLMMVEQIGT